MGYRMLAVLMLVTVTEPARADTDVTGWMHRCYVDVDAMTEGVKALEGVAQSEAISRAKKLEIDCRVRPLDMCKESDQATACFQTINAWLELRSNAIHSQLPRKLPEHVGAGRRKAYQSFLDGKPDLRGFYYYSCLGRGVAEEASYSREDVCRAESAALYHERSLSVWRFVRESMRSQ
jgi:hypothetical protein